MGVYDYKGLSATESASLVSLTHDLAVYSQLKSVFGLPVGDIFEDIGKLFGDGAITSNPIDVGIPDGWRVVSAAELGLPAESVDSNGYIKTASPVTGMADSGPQLLVLAEEAADGSVSRLCVSYVGTNSLLDVADFAYLNTGKELAAGLEPVLSAVAGLATQNGLTGEDVLVTGYSLGGGMTNIQARFADTLADGFFADSLYVGHAAPVIYDEGGRVLNVGYENDVVHRAAGNAASFWEALASADPLLSNSDSSYASSMDNTVIFDGAYAAAGLTLAIDSILNPLAWWGHGSGLFSDALDRIGNSVFHEFTHRDSAIVVSALGADLRGTVWVEDKAAPTSDHFGAPAFIIGTAYDDRLKDGAANDWLEGGAGNDLIRVEAGLNRVDGGTGTDTLRVIADPGAVSVYRLGDGTMVFDTGHAVTLAQNIEKVEIGKPGLLGLIDWTTEYSIQANRLEDEHWSLFEWGDRDIAYSHAVSGGAGNDALAGRAVFGQGGDDRITGTSGADLLHGGEGRDVISGGAGNDRLFGAEHADRLIAGSGTDRLNGGHGDDVFVFDAAIRGTAIVEDFNDLAGEHDHLAFVGGDAATALASAVQQGDNVVIQHGAMTVVLEDTQLDALLMA